MSEKQAELRKWITRLAKSKDPLVRRDAARVLSQQDDPRTIEPLIQALQDPNEWVRFAAAQGLGEKGDIRAVEPLTKALRDKVWRVRWAAAEALGKLRDRRAIPALERASDPAYEPDEETRIAAREALERLRKLSG